MLQMSGKNAFKCFFPDSRKNRWDRKNSANKSAISGSIDALIEFNRTDDVNSENFSLA